MLKKLFLVSLIVIPIITLSIRNKNDPITNSYIVKEGAVPKEVPIAQLIIDKISINNYIYSYDSINNTVEKNVELLAGSTFPDKENSIVFLAAHSGNSNISYFNNLDRLKKKDKIIFYYKDYKYEYSVDYLMSQEKDGDIEINKTSKNQLILTTCSTTNKNKQLIVSSYLVNKYKI